ncbi:MAG: thioredoxin family protein [Thaumarchaeota archaeon]|nr:thioredoxin family protein [Nitrososphaerota archaeon]
MSRVIDLTSQNFDKMLKSSKKLFVDFWAPWCGPCLKMNPVVERLANKHSSITFAKVNIDEHQEIANRYHIMSLPAYLIFTNSSPESSRTGSTSEIDLERMLDDATSL